MWWFDKERPREIWDQAIQWPIGDIEAADRIRNICRSASDSAERLGGFNTGTEKKRKSDLRQHDIETARYERAARVAMEIAMKISDGLMRDSAVSEIIELCLKADDRRTARILFRAIQAASIREAMLKDHPALSE